MSTAILNLRDVLRKGARKYLPNRVFEIGAERYNRFRCKHAVHPSDFERFISIRYGQESRVGGEAVPVRIDTLQHPIYIRPGKPDAEELIHSGIREAYKMYLPECEVKFIIDAGAYIGDTTAWYLSRFPQSSVVALEPTPETFAMLERNTAPYGSRVRTLNAALWTEDGELELIFNEATPTGISVAEHGPGKAEKCAAVSIGTILEQAEESVIDILKLDIEGAELELFKSKPDPWLSRTRSIAIEIHSPEAYAAVESATRRHGFAQTQYRELYFFLKGKS